MHRLLVDTASLAEALPILPKDAARHLKVLRPESGEEVELFDGQGSARRYQIALDGGATELRAAGELFKVSRPKLELILFACVTKGSRWDWTIEKATEIGATKIVPVISERTIVRLDREERAAKRERWLRIAEDAVRQCDGYWLPEITEAVDFRDVLAQVATTDCYIGALTNPASEPLATAVAARRDVARPLATFVGPEGDLTSEELAALMAVATPTSFGERVLRAETAALYALSVLAATVKE